MRNQMLGTIGGIGVLLLTACSGGESDPVPSAGSAHVEPSGQGSDGYASDGHESDGNESDGHDSGQNSDGWSYTGDTGPEAWAELDASYAACAGDAQSPVDLSAGAAAGATAALELAYTASSATVTDDGHTLKAEVGEGGSTATLDGVAHDLVQMHFHAPSEHTVDGEPAAAEMHFVHAADDGGLLVVGVLATEGVEDVAWAPYLSAADLPAGRSVEVPVDWAGIAPDVSAYRQYPGSLTTPPCSETVTWVVADAPLELSAEQIAALDAAFDDNARPTQPLGDREVVLHE
ncbi:carbonic anhydrase [Sediminihabitans luteus]|uniref:carbonic anhydrase n=1 Tax=Sediminihabitans luteus TaxID=1138585 RepID=A0A2M9CZD7_9CELL|nr:carbonic anhydrase family protein [Sediminihabitans luteus]PJJ77195.1 carbonic anhydrase [Sediminihabitans luteus]GII98643.1 hypothetical protein Slu03_10210 [Sediminihabitans luteus]